VDFAVFDPKRVSRGLAALALVVLFCTSAFARAPEPVVVNKVVKEVRLTGSPDSRPVAEHDQLPDGAALQTGADAWAELSCPDASVVRLAGNTTFSLAGKARRLNLTNGALLLEISKKARGTRIQAGDVSAELAGTTVVFELHGKVYKFFVMQGTARLFRPGHLGESILVQPGQMAIGTSGAALPDPVDFDIGRFVKTSKFVTDFAPLTTAPLMAAETEKQARRISKKKLIETNLVLFGGGTNVSLVQDPNKKQPDLPADSGNNNTAVPAAPLPGSNAKVVDQAMAARK